MNKPSDFSHFKYDSAKKQDSSTRKLIGAGAPFLDSMQDELRPKLLAAAILGDDTLKAYIEATKIFQKSNENHTKNYFVSCLDFV